jgi:carbamoyl-phosphate synthase small subunit
MQLTPAQLILKTGESFQGQAPISQKDIHFGEVVFNTGMVGYVESLTDPSYAGEILAFTYPLIGNYGVADPKTWESKKIHAKGVVMSELVDAYSNHSAQRSLYQWLHEQQVPFITGVDTRALTKRLRTTGVVAGVIITGDQPVAATKKQLKFPDYDQIDWVKEVSIKEPVMYGAGKN